MQEYFATQDTIAAPATPVSANGGVTVIRISGPQALAVLRACFAMRGQPRPRMMHTGQVLLEGKPVDRALGVYFPAPRSYTGEDVAELHCHGGAAVAQAVLRALYAAGARPAQPGEFTRRAFENGKLDLAQAEAVMDLIQARGTAAHALALRQLDGALSRRIDTLQDELVLLLARIEVTVDYPEEDIEDQTAQEALQAVHALQAQLEALLAQARAGKVLREGVRCVLAGRPNAGKSSLLNALLGEQRAIVTDIPGTTRDTLDADAQIDGLSVTYIDTAGIRPTGDEIERIGVQRAQKALAQAAIVVLVVDAYSGITTQDKQIFADAQGMPCIIALNKTDLAPVDMAQAAASFPGARVVPVSALTFEGLPDQQKAIYELACGGAAMHSALLANERHIAAAREALTALNDAQAALGSGFTPDLAATDLRRARNSLGLITGRTADEEIVDIIFSRFCLGK